MLAFSFIGFLCHRRFRILPGLLGLGSGFRILPGLSEVWILSVFMDLDLFGLSDIVLFFDSTNMKTI